MKIIFLNLYSGKIERGAESQAHQLAEQLKKTHVVLFVEGKSDVISQHGFEGNLFQKWFNRKRWFIDDAGIEILKFSLSHVKTLISEKPDWIIPMNGFWELLTLKILQPFLGFKILIIGHSGPGWDERWNLYLKPDVFVASTGPTLEWARKTCSWTKVEMIPYGIDASRFKHLESRVKSHEKKHKSTIKHKTLDLKHLQNPLILCPSALVPYKQVDLAIKAVAKMEKGSLLVLGKGPLESELKELGESLLGSKRFLLTSVTYDDMSIAYTSANIVTLPSTPQENSPMVFVEALAAGKRVVATDAPRVRWALEKSGFYVDPTDSNEYALALQNVTNSKTNTIEPLEKFLWKNVLKQYLNVLEIKEK